MRGRPELPAPPVVPEALERARDLRLGDFLGIAEYEVEDSFVGQSADALDIRRSRLRRAALTSCRLHRLVLIDVAIEGCDFSGADLEEASLTRVHFRDCRMSGLAIARSSLRDVRFSDCRVDGANLRMCDLDRVTFENDDLRSSDFSGTTCTHVRFFDCNLSGADFSKVAARGTRLHGSVLMDLKGAGDLRGVIIDSTQLVPLGVQVLGALGISVDDEREPEPAPRGPKRRGLP